MLILQGEKNKFWLIFLAVEERQILAASLASEPATGSITGGRSKEVRAMTKVCFTSTVQWDCKSFILVYVYINAIMEC